MGLHEAWEPEFEGRLRGPSLSGERRHPDSELSGAIRSRRAGKLSCIPVLLSYEKVRELMWAFRQSDVIDREHRQGKNLAGNPFQAPVLSRSVKVRVLRSTNGAVSVYIPSSRAVHLASHQLRGIISGPRTKPKASPDCTVNSLMIDTLMVKVRGESMYHE